MEIEARTVLPLEVEVRHVVEADEHEGTAETTEHVGAGTLEHGLDSLVGENLVEAVNGAGVLAGIATGGHHHATTDGVQGVGDQTGNDGHRVADGELGGEVGVDEEGLRGVVESEVGSTVEDDADARHNEAVVDSALAPAGLLGGLRTRDQ